MAASPTETIKERLDVVEFLKGYLTLQPAGKNFKALCPFHREKTPSFMVSPERQSWHCFGCGLGGDIFSFLMRYENVEFGEALRVLAERAGVELRRLNPAEYKFAGLLYDINNAAKEFFIRELGLSEAAKQYLKERGLTGATIQEFELGWAPNEPEALAMHFLKQGYDPEDLIRAGLVIKTERGARFDRFRGRIMFPIHNHFGKVVGFTGRILPTRPEPVEGSGNPSTSSGLAVAKYMNSPETPIFAKSKLLYGFSKTKNAIREAGKAFLVEGQMDLLMSWQAGVRHVVASSGTALTADHLRVLRRVADQLVVSFDNDEAGLAAGERAIDLAEASDFDVRVATFSGYKDPADAAQADPAGLSAVVAAGKPAMEFYFDRYLPKGSFEFRDRATLNNIRAVVGKIKNIASPIQQGFWIKELSKRIKVEEKFLIEEAGKLAVNAPAFSRGEEAAETQQRNFTRRDLIGQELLSAALAKNDFALVEDSLPYFTGMCREAGAVLQRGERTASDPKLDEVINLVVLRAGEFSPREVEDLKKHLSHEYFKERRLELTELVKRAEAEGNKEALEGALREFGQLPVV
ncbi:MAG: primase protein [Parcubacteria group bacterium GW2011_GWB1_56_8]|nr:MAG: primase protein [Parcubacteria group bacterium GW2011_GWB1_56_8]